MSFKPCSNTITLSSVRPRQLLYTSANLRPRHSQQHLHGVYSALSDYRSRLMHSYHPEFVATQAYHSEVVAIKDESIMAFFDFHTRQYVPGELQLHDGSNEVDVTHWPEYPLMSQRPFEAHYRFSSELQLADSYEWIPDLNTTSSAHQLFSHPRYPAFQSPQGELQHPYYSSPPTLYNNSSASSDRLSPSIGSRASSLLPSPHPCHVEVPGLDFTSYSDAAYEDSSCVAMQNVQKTADTMNEDPVDNYNSYEYEPQELVFVASEYHESTLSAYGQPPIPIAQQETRDESPPEPSPEPAPKSEPDSDYEADPIRTAPRRRGAPKKPSSATRNHNGVNKRRLTQQTPRPSRSREDIPRAFLCPLAPYGCKSAFNAKNEWKRHAMTQHFRMGFWRCDQCTDSPDRPNDFNRKDLFVQHVRRMHPTNTAVLAPQKKSRAQVKGTTMEAALNKIAERCYQLTQLAPESSCCVFCEETFEGEGAMEARTEHVGKHMESRRKEGLDPVAVGDWREDEELEAWLLLHGTIVRKRGVLEVSK